MIRRKRWNMGRLWFFSQLVTELVSTPKRWATSEVDPISWTGG